DTAGESDAQDGAAVGSTESGSASAMEGRPVAELMQQALGEKAEQESGGKCAKLVKVLAILASEVAQLKAQLAMAIKDECGEKVLEGIDNPVREKVKAVIGEVVQEGIGNPITMKVKSDPPKRCRTLKEPHFEGGDKDNIASLAEPHAFEGKQQEREVARAMKADIGEVAQGGTNNPVTMKVKSETPAKCRMPKEPHFEDGNMEDIDNLKRSHELDGKQHELGGIVAMAEGVPQDSERQDKFDGGEKANIEDGAKVLVGGAATLCEEREAKQKEQEGAVKHFTISKGSVDSTALADAAPLGTTVQRAVALPLARARPSAAEAATAQAYGKALRRQAALVEPAEAEAEAARRALERRRAERRRCRAAADAAEARLTKLEATRRKQASRGRGPRKIEFALLGCLRAG
ncbi:unnamed protein product, partial [Prorocentrum cordatum]